MNPIAQAKIAAAAAVLLLVVVGLWYTHHHGYEAGKLEVMAAWATERDQIAEEQKAALVAYANQTKHAEEQHNEDQAIIDRLHDAAGRVRITLPTCPGNGAANQNPNGTAGIFSKRVDQLFAEFQERVGGIVRRCDELNADARALNTQMGVGG